MDLLPLALVVLVLLFVLVPFRRRIGGAGGGAEKGLVGALWIIAAVIVAVVIANR